jgi:hypothetical protein
MATATRCRPSWCAGQLLSAPLVTRSVCYTKAKCWLSTPAVLHRNFGQKALKPVPLVGRSTALSLVVIDGNDAIPWPSQSDGMVGEGVLPLTRFPMVENLLGIGLAHIDKGETIEVMIKNLRRSQNARPESGPSDSSRQGCS